MKNKKVLITGAYGLLGAVLSKNLKDQGYNLFRHGKKINRAERFSLIDRKILFKNLRRINPSAIINLSALTNIEECENNFFKALEINTLCVENFSEYLKYKNQIRFIHISTDQVYHGKGPHNEDKVNPVNNYALTKYLGEQALNSKKTLILRTNFVGRSLIKDKVSLTDWFISSVKKKKKISLYSDIYFNPLEINFLSKLIIKIMKKKINGIFNIGSNGGMSKAKFLLKISKTLKLNSKKCKVVKVNFSKKTLRPKNMIMNCNKFEKKFCMKLPSIEDQIHKVCKSYENQ